ncbi:MAG: polyprenyl synthetase family protein [Flavobacteriales bacterium]
MRSLEEIKAVIADEMELFEKKFKESMKSNAPLLDKITYYIVKRKGKQIRPMFVFLAANLTGKISESTYRAAGLIELLHTATLVHDDVVDDANERRGFFSVNALWKNKIAVLVGDYLLSKGLLLSLDNNEFDVLRIVSNSVRAMSEGELLQIEKARKLDITEQVYFDIIRQKTATLIASCCASGACSAGADKNTIEMFRRIGENIGIAFQIKDDLFDFQIHSKAGKPTGIDIKERKMTLPLIHTLQKASKADKRMIINTFKHYNTDPKRVNEVIYLVNSGPGIAYATEQMNNYRDQAIEELMKFPESASRQSFIDLIYFTTERKR